MQGATYDGVGWQLCRHSLLNWTAAPWTPGSCSALPKGGCCNIWWHSDGSQLPAAAELLPRCGQGPGLQLPGLP